MKFNQYNGAFMFVLMLVMAIVSVSAVGTNDVVLSTPADGAWTNTTNYTTGFTFTWTDYGDALYATANCSLYVSNVTDFLPTLITSTYLQSSVLASRGVETTLYMDTDAFLSNGTTQYWSVKCFNTSSTDGRGTTGWTPTAYTLNQDVAIPQWVVLGTSFTNNTWSTTGAVRFEVNLTDSGYDNGGDYTISIVNNSDATQTFGSATTTNNTAVNVTATLTTGNTTMELKFCDPAGNCNSTTSDYLIKVDSTDPVVTFTSPTIATGGNTSNTYVYVNFTVTELNNDTVTLTFDGTDYVVEGANLTGTAPALNGFFNVSGLSATRNAQYNVTVNDSAGNEITTTTRTVSIDTAGTALTTIYNWTVVDSVASYRVLVTDTTPYTCTAKIYDSGDVLRTTDTGSWGTIGATTNCTGTFIATDIITDGEFTVQYTVTDEVGNSATSNKTGIMTSLYAGWNLITWGDENTTALNVCNTIESCTSVSWFNNTASTYTTYSTSTPSVNNDTQITEGDAVYVYVSSDDYLIVNDYMPEYDISTENITLKANAWNTIGLFYNTTVNTTLYAANVSGAGAITWGSWIDVDAGTYYTCSKSLSLCTGTTNTPVEIVLPRGRAMWVLTDGAMVINRSTLSG